MSAGTTTQPGNSDSTEGYQPFRIDTSAPPADADRMTLFFIDDREYTGPRQITGALALRALQMTVTHGQAAGAYYALEQAIGSDAVEALLNCEQLSYEQAREFLSRISAMYYGQAMGLTGK